MHLLPLFLYSDVSIVKLQFLYSATPALHRRGSQAQEYPVICLTIMAPSLDICQPEMYFLTPQLSPFQKSKQLESLTLVFSDQLLSVGNRHLKFFHVISWLDCLFLFVANYDSAVCLIHNLFIHSCTEVW